jgi:hypothetical protein
LAPVVPIPCLVPGTDRLELGTSGKTLEIQERKEIKKDGWGEINV